MNRKLAQVKSSLGDASTAAHQAKQDLPEWAEQIEKLIEGPLSEVRRNVHVILDAMADKKGSGK